MNLTQRSHHWGAHTAPHCLLLQTTGSNPQLPGPHNEFPSLVHLRIIRWSVGDGILRTSTCEKLVWLVVEPHPSEKYEFVSWGCENFNIWKNKKCSKPPTRCSRINCKVCKWISLFSLPTANIHKQPGSASEHGPRGPRTSIIYLFILGWLFIAKCV